MRSKPTLLTVGEINYAQLGEFLTKFGFVERETTGEHHLFEHETEKDWVFLFPGGERYERPVDGTDWINVRVHLDYWGFLEADTTEELVRKLQE